MKRDFGYKNKKYCYQGMSTDKEYIYWLYRQEEANYKI